MDDDKTRPWKDAVGRLRRIVRDDDAFVRAGLDKDRVRARNAVAGLYVRYMVSSNELSKWHNNIVQLQLRDFIKKMLMSIYGRILELKQILTEEDSSIYTPIIEQLIIHQITHDQFELNIPRCFCIERQTLLEQVDSDIDEITKHIDLKNNIDEKQEGNDLKDDRSIVNNSDSEDSSESDFDVLTLMQNKHNIPERFTEITREEILRKSAIKLIQKHIRAMHDRIFVNELLAAKRTRENIISGKYIRPSKEKSHKAAVKIQRFWRFYHLMRQSNVRTKLRNILLGIYCMPSDRSNSALLKYELQENEIRSKQIQAALKLNKYINKCQEKLNQRNKYKIIEEIEDELRAYIKTYYETCKLLPAWPDSVPTIFTDDNILGLPPIILPSNILKELNIPSIHYKSPLNQQVPLGGSAVFHTGRWMTIEMAKILATTILEFEKKPVKERKKLINDLKLKNKTEKEKAIQISEQIVQEREQNRAFGVVPEPSDLTEWFKEIFDEFDRDWKTNNGSDEQPREDLIKSKLYSNAQIEFRALADIHIGEELDRLKIANLLDSGKKSKKPKEKTKKSKTKGKARTNKNKLPNSKEIFEELVRNNMIRKSVVSEFKEFQGEVSCFGTTMQDAPNYLDLPYGLGDIRQIIKELFVIGLVFPELRTLKQIKFSSSLLIAGPEKSGKTMLINSICTETGSLKIKLTLNNVYENYSTPKQINRLVNIIVEFAQTYQPVVIEVDLADVPFYKKIPKNLKSFKPRLMAKVLKKLLKTLKKKDRVIIVGKATSPWLAIGKKLTSVFQTIVFTAPDYNSIFMFVNNLLMSYPAISREFPVSPLATMLSGCSRQVIADIVAEVMTTKRVIVLKNNPLDPTEFVSIMMKYPKMEPLELYYQYHNWYKENTGLGVERSLKIQEKKEADKKTKKTKK